jgi:hypothetical protein
MEVRRCKAHEDYRRRKLAAIRKHSGMLTGAYGPRYCERRTG